MILITGGLGSIGSHTARAIALLMQAQQLNHHIYNISSGRPVRLGDVVDAINAAVPGANLVLPAGRNPDGSPVNHLDIAGCGTTPASSRSTTSPGPCRTTPTG
jgi:nucleoside-diphosphate-sugar epimerase